MTPQPKPPAVKPFCGVCGDEFDTVKQAEKHYRQHWSRSGKTTESRRRPSPPTQRYLEAVARRKILRQALDLIRRNPLRRKEVLTLARTLGGSTPDTAKTFKMAQAIIAEHGS